MGIKIGICHWSLPMEGPYGIKLAAELGLQGIQLDVGSYERGFLLSLPAVQKAYLEMSQKHNVTITSLAVRELDNYGLTREDGTKEKDIALEAVMTAVDIAEAMGITNVMVPSFEASDIKTQVDFNSLVNILKQACDKAINKSIIISTENLLSIEENKNLFEKVDRPNLSLYFDTQNYNLRKNYNAAEMVEALFPYICEVHAKDGRNGFMSGALLGEGDSGFYDTLEALKKNKYDGWIVLENYYDQEPLSLTGKGPIELLKEDVSILKKAINLNE